jgi:hypothetical protein
VGSAVSTAKQGHVAYFPFLLKQTLATFLQLQVGSNGYTVVTDPSSSQLRYVDNVFFGPKFHVQDQGDVWPSLAMSAEASLPSFRTDGESRNDDAFVTAYASKDVGFVHVDWNVGVDVWRVDQPSVAQAFTALALLNLGPPTMSTCRHADDVIARRAKRPIEFSDSTGSRWTRWPSPAAGESGWAPATRTCPSLEPIARKRGAANLGDAGAAAFNYAARPGFGSFDDRARCDRSAAQVHDRFQLEVAAALERPIYWG